MKSSKVGHDGIVTAEERVGPGGLPEALLFTTQTPERAARKEQRKRNEFYLTRKRGEIELGERLGGYWPAIKVAKEAIRQMAVGNQAAHLTARLSKELGLSDDQRSRAVRVLCTVPAWFEVTRRPGAAASVRAKRAAVRAVQYGEARRA